MISRALRFVDLGQLREPALAALDDVTMLPAAGRARLEAFVKGRSEWCLSRQRSWGVPLPVFYHKTTGEALLDEEVLSHVRGLVSLHGSNCWWELPTEELLPPSRRAEAEQWTRGTDTMDVWFDSGTSWSAVLAADGVPATETADAEGADLRQGSFRQADLYLEGSDQHRGWFQSSLLTHVGAVPGGNAPYRAIVTHGFVVDEKGAKMSKSIGNVITPNQLIDPATDAAASGAAIDGGGSGGGSRGGSGGGGQKASGAAKEAEAINASKQKRKQKEARKAQHARAPYGVDVLRLWVAMADWKSDVALGDAVLERSRDTYRRLRNACRFCLGNLTDYDASVDAVPFEELRQGDRHMLHLLAGHLSAVRASYDNYELHRVVASTLTLATESLSAEYFDSTKDRLYCGDADGASRRAVQTVLHASLEAILLSVGPILPFLAEEVRRRIHSP